MIAIEHPAPTEVSATTLYARGRDLLFRIADDIKPPAEYQSPYIGQGSVLNAIVLCEAASLRGREEDLHAAAAHLRHGMALLDEVPLSSSLYRGITGFGWALQVFPMPELMPEREEILRDLDELLADGLEVTRNHNIDIINGIAGVAVYALARGGAEPSSQALWQALDALIVRYCAQWAPGSHENAKHASNNLGLAHGIPGLLAVGAVAHARGLLSAGAGAALKNGFDAFWSVAREPEGRCWYPTYQSVPTRSRLAWCYGGLGIAAIFKLGIALDAANAARFERVLVSSIAQYESGDHGIRDASLCHGDAGVTLSLEYLARGVGIDADLRRRLHLAATHAGALALDAERSDLGVGAFLHSTAQGMVHKMSFLEGGAGIALAITSAYADAPRPWMQLIGYY